MKNTIFVLGLLCASSFSEAYSTYQRSNAASSGDCCQLSPWGYAHIDIVRELANRVRQDYIARARGGNAARYTHQPWSEHFINTVGKTNEEADMVAQQLSNQIIGGMQSGRTPYSVIAKPNFFETQAANTLESIIQESEADNQQQQVELYTPELPDVSDMSKFDEIRHVTYPTEVKVVDGQKVITSKNCTTATMRGGSVTNPIIRTVRVNRTTTHTTVPVYGSSVTQPFLNNEEHRIYNHLKQKEVGVPNYSPEVTVDGSLVVGMKSNRPPYTPPIVIPVEGGDQGESLGFMNQLDIRPGHTVTIRKYNRTIITGPDGAPFVTGSHSQSVWDNGQWVYNLTMPFGSVGLTKDDIWKREERERLYWLFQGRSVNLHDLEEWQKNQEDRLLALAYRSNQTLEEIEEWQRHELERFKNLFNQYNTVSSGLKNWQLNERGRIDWLIHQNGITREDLARWQLENEKRLQILARQYQTSLDELKEFHRQELERLYSIFNAQNTQMTSHDLKVLQQQESNRLNQILLHHNATIDQLQEQIRRERERYKDLAQQYRLSVEDMEKFFKNELNRLSAVIAQQQGEIKRLTDWQRSERSRLEDIIRHHNLTVDELEQKMKLDRSYLQSLAKKYHITLDELEKWQQSELNRLHETGKMNLQKELEEWQKQERERMLAILKKNDLTIEEYQAKVGNDRARLQQLATMYQVQVEEIEKWLREEAQRLKSEGSFSDVQKNLTLWQQQERDRLQAIVQNNDLTIEELQNKIKNDQTRLYSLANTYQVQVEEIEDWLKKELLRLQSQGLVKIDDLEDWQKAEREKLLQLVHDNKLTVGDFEKNLLNDKNRLQRLATQYHVELKDIEAWLRKESERLKGLGLIEEEKLTEWQKIERDRLLDLLNKNKLSIDELQEKIKSDQVHLYSLAHQYSIRVEEIEDWLKKEVMRLQNQANLDAAALKDWQKIERERLMNLVNQNELTIDEFTQRLITDRQYLQQLAMQYKVEIEEIEQWIRNEGFRLETLGLIKPNAPLTQWQEVERNHLLEIVQNQGQVSLDELEQRLKDDRKHLYTIAQEYKVQVSDIEDWVKKELQRLQNQGVLQIEQLKEWQQAERDHLTALVAGQQNEFSVDEVERQLKADRQRLQNLAYENNVQVKEIEEWIHKELARLKNRGQTQIDNLNEWQAKERERLLSLAQQQSDLSAAELEKKLQADRNRLQQLAWQYHIEVEDVEDWIRKEVQRLRDQGQLHIENLAAWQIGERDRLQKLIQQHLTDLSIEDVEKQLKAERNRLQHLAWQYHIQVEEVEEWIRKEAERLRNQGQLHIGNLTDWQLHERQRIQNLIKQNNDLTLEEVQRQLKADHNRLQQLAWQHNVDVEEVERWINGELQRLRNEGQLHIEDLTAWQKAQRERLLELAHQQSQLTLAEFENRLIADRRPLELLAMQYHISVQEIEDWIKKEAERLENQGIIGNLQEWQKLERARIQDLIKQNNLTVEDLQQQIKNDHARLQQLAWQYHVSVDEIEKWILKDGVRQISPANLGDWRQNEKERLLSLAQVRDLTLGDIEVQLQNDHDRLDQIARHYHVTLKEIEDWIRQEGRRIAKPLAPWQELELQRLQNQLRQNPDITPDQYEAQISANRNRLQQLAHQYHITVEDVEEWIRNEGKKFLKPESLTDWQQDERNHLHQFLQQHPHLTYDDWKAEFKPDYNTLQQLAQKYHVPPIVLDEWITKEGKRQITPKPLPHWKEVERERLRLYLQQHPGYTFEEWTTEYKPDHVKMAQLAQQYGVPIEELNDWITKEGKRQIKPVVLTPWQQAERDYLIVYLQQHPNITFDEWQVEYKADPNRLQQLSQQYQVTVSEIQDWILKEAKRRLKPIPLTNWQQAEREELLKTIQDHLSYTLEDLENQVKTDRPRLQQLAQQYHVTVDEIEQWILKDGKRLIKPKPLSEWQLVERKHLLEQLLQPEGITDVELERLIRDNRQRLQRIAKENYITIQMIEEWIRREGQRLINPANLNQWQLQERERLLALIRDDPVTLEELREILHSDRPRLEQLAAQYHITVEEVEEWIIDESRKLTIPSVVTEWQRKEHDRILRLIQENQLTIEQLRQQLKAERPRLQEIANKYHENVEDVEEWILLEGHRLIKPDSTGSWQQHEREYLLALAQTNIITLNNFETHLANDHLRLENVASHYNVSTDEIKDFLRNEVQRLAKLNLVSTGEDQSDQLLAWQLGEQQHIQQLLQEHTWSIEELERRLHDDRNRLRDLANQYHISVDQIRQWYLRELQKLLQQKTIYTENLSDWQKREKERLYLTINQHNITIEELERQLSRDQNALRMLAAQYHITIDQLINWQRNELKRLGNLQLGKTVEVDGFNDWQIAERNRLRSIPQSVIITKEELLQFLASDKNFQGNLTLQYHITPEELTAFQAKEIQKMDNEGLLEKINLKHLEDWQRRERDRLYNLIRTQSFSLKNIRGWQTPDRLQMIASIYRIPSETIRNWQYQEMQRITDVAAHCQMTLNRLEDFRNGELERLNFVAHKVAIPASEYRRWTGREDSRLNALASRLRISNRDRLNQWRRKLFLLAQGLIDLNSNEGGYGGIELNTNTSASGKRNETISSDRGDQPPQVYHEEFDDYEPSLGSYSDHTAPMAQVPPYGHRQTQNYGQVYNPHGHINAYGYSNANQGERYGHGSGLTHGQGYGHGYSFNQYPTAGQRIEGQSVQRKKEYTFIAPGSVHVPIPTAYTPGYSSSNNYFQGVTNHNVQSDGVTADDQDDGGQQQQLDWYSDGDQGQQVVQQESIDFDSEHISPETNTDVRKTNEKESVNSDSEHISSETNRDAHAANEKVVAAELEPTTPSAWNKIKDKAKSWFG